MFRIISGAAVLAASIYLALKYSKSASFDSSIQNKSIFEFQVDSVDGEHPISLSEFQGKKAYLVVNVASQCGLTNKNYAELNELYEKYQ